MGRGLFLAGNFTDLRKFDPVVLEWELLESGSRDPSARTSFGFTSAGGSLYLFGGVDNAGALDFFDSRRFRGTHKHPAFDPLPAVDFHDPFRRRKPAKRPI